MTISLCGSPPPGFLEAFIFGLIAAAGFLFYAHYRVYQSEYYKNEFVYFSSGKKAILYLSFLVASLSIVPLLFLICFIIFT